MGAMTAASAAEFYVSPQGQDSNPGTRQAPWKTWQGARDGVRAFRNATPGEAVTVYFTEGTYPLEAPVLLSAQDGGTAQAPVVYAALPGAKPVFTGSVVLKTWQQFKDYPWTGDPADLDYKVLRFSLPHATRDTKLYIANLKTEGITETGDPTEMGNRPDLYVDGELQTLARWPNKGLTQAGRAMGSTPVGKNWANFNGYMEGVFEYQGDRQVRWQNETDPRLGGYWFWDWREEYLKLRRVDASAHLIYTQEPYHTSGYKDSLRYFGLNLLCELDTPGEWYLDRERGLLIWYPQTPPTADNRVTLSMFNAPYMVELDGCSNVSLQGLSFEESRGSAIRIQGGENCLVAECRIERMGRDGIHVEGGKNHGISGSLLRTLGCAGIDLVGGDRKTLTPGGHFVENTVVDNFSIFKRTYEPALRMDGCGLRASHNYFWNSSSSAMRIEGNDLLVEYNDIGNVVNESDDQGGLDSFYNPSYLGNVIRYNRWRNIVGGTHCGAAGIRLDDMISGVLVYGNVLENCGSHHFAGVQINGGKDNLVENNLFWECPAAVSWYEFPWTQHRWDTMMAKEETRRKIFEEVDIRSQLYLSRYPKLAQIYENACSNTVSNNLLVDCAGLAISANDKQTFTNNQQIASQGRTIEQVCTPEVLKSYGLQPIPLSEMGVQKNPWWK